MSECRYCHEDLERLPAEANVFRHRVGLCVPSRNEVETCIETLEIEDEREKEALRRFYQRERHERIPRWLGIFGILACLGLFWGFAIAWLYPAIHRWLARFLP